MSSAKRVPRPHVEAGLPKAVKYVLSAAGLGALIGIGIGLLLILTNVAGLRDLIGNSSDPITPVILVMVGFATLFGGIHAGTSIMRLPDEEADENA